MKERKLISQIKSRFAGRSDQLLKGIGDDCAVLKDSPGLCWLVSSDLLVENTHFILEYHKPYLLGRKSIAVNLSDIAAMGGSPKFVLISLSLPEYISDGWISDWLQGAESILAEYNCFLIGGDTTQGAILTINVTILGTSDPDNVVYRSGAKADQDIYVAGPLGSSAAGLELLKRGESYNKEYLDLVHAHLDPRPQVNVGLALGESGLVTAMQDISDGLSTDISHICRESAVGAILQEDRLPYADGLQKLCCKYDLDIRELMLKGGEDYTLVFTAEYGNRDKLRKLANQLDLTFYRVGRTNSNPGVFLQKADNQVIDICFRGFEHEF